MARKWWHRRRKQSEAARAPAADQSPPLREFVYLDEVSLRSLLASQTGALTEAITDLLSRADEAEIASSVSAASPVLKAELSSRFQTTNSQSSQTSRKSIVQSLFKEFRELEGVHLLLEPSDANTPPSEIEELVASGSAIAVDDLVRGSLVEVEVELVADPIFRFSTIISEITDMSKEYPDMLAAAGTAGVMQDAEPINRVLQRLLAGLIPLRSRATSLVKIEHLGIEYLVPLASVAQSDMETTPVSIVGVTEHLSYWRDVRRVIFSGAKFTMLCRIARTGAHKEWVPVKLTEVLAEIAPEFPRAIDAVGRVGYEQTVDTFAIDQEVALQTALATFIDLACAEANVDRSSANVKPAFTAALSCAGMATSASNQNEAFRTVLAALRDDAEINLPSDTWLTLQRDARDRAQLVLFRGPLRVADYGRQSVEQEAEESNEVLLDTEVIAIYW